MRIYKKGCTPEQWREYLNAPASKGYVFSDTSFNAQEVSNPWVEIPEEAKDWKSVPPISAASDQCCSHPCPKKVGDGGSVCLNCGRFTDLMSGLRQLTHPIPTQSGPYTNRTANSSPRLMKIEETDDYAKFRIKTNKTTFVVFQEYPPTLENSKHVSDMCDKELAKTGEAPLSVHEWFEAINTPLP